MAKSSSDQLYLIDMRTLWRRVLLVVPVVVVMAGAWFALRWYLGNTMASSMTALDIETARAAARLAPDDPLTHRALALLNKNSFLIEDLRESVREYEQAVRLSPNDYRLWMSLGRTREQAGDAAGGEQALRRAVELAPFYADPRWLLGNLLLRQQRIEEAFAELRRAGDAEPSLRPQVFNLAWYVYQKDIGAVTAAVGNSAAARAQLVDYLVKQNRLDDGLRLWESLTAAEKRAERGAGEVLMRALFEAKRFPVVLQIYRDLTPEDTVPLSIGSLLNGGFEDEISPPGRSFFGWQVQPAAQPQIRVDAGNSRGGRRSLRLVFNVPATLDFRNVSQFVVVEPATRYRLEYFIRTEELKSATTPVTEIVDAANPDRVLGTSAPLPPGTNDWQVVAIDFITSAQTEAVTVRLNRTCLGAVCPIFGRVWYDDFDLKHIGSGGAGAPGDGARRGDAAAGGRNSRRGGG